MNLGTLDLVLSFPGVESLVQGALVGAVVWFLPLFTGAKTLYGVALLLKPLTLLTPTKRDDAALAKAIRWLEFGNDLLAALSKVKIRTAIQVWGDFFNPPAPPKAKRK